MQDRNDILQDSPAWDELRRNGIPSEVSPVELRRFLHHMLNIIVPMVAYINEALDQSDRLDTNLAAETVDRKAEDQKIRRENKWVFRAIVLGLVSMIGTLIVLYLTTKAGTPS